MTVDVVKLSDSTYFIHNLIYKWLNELPVLLDFSKYPELASNLSITFLTCLESMMSTYLRRIEFYKERQYVIIQSGSLFNLSQVLEGIRRSIRDGLKIPFEFMSGMSKAKEGCLSRCEEILMEFIAFKYKAKTLEYVKNLILHEEPLKVTNDLRLTYCKDIVDDINAIDFPSYIDFNKEGIKIYNKNLAL